MELMVVVLLIAVMAMIAVPTLSSARYDRHAYDDAGYVNELFRMARTRALARGGAVLVHMKADGTSGQRGRFEIWEAVTTDVGDGGAGQYARTPMNSCKSPTVWSLTSTSTTSFFVDAVDMNGKIEQEANIVSSIADPANAAVTDAYLCFTPLGHVFYSTTASFDTALPMNGVIQVTVSIADSSQSSGYRGIRRRVVVPSSGMARMISL